MHWLTGWWTRTQYCPRISITDEEQPAHQMPSECAVDMMNKTFNCWAKQLKVLEIGDEKTTHSIQIMTLCTASTAPTVHDCKNAALSLPPAASTTSHCTKPFMQFHYYYYSLSREESSNIFFPTIPPPFSEPSCIISHSAEDDDHPTSEAFRKRQATSTSNCRTEQDFSKLPILSLLPSSLLTEGGVRGRLAIPS